MNERVFVIVLKELEKSSESIYIDTLLPLRLKVTGKSFFIRIAHKQPVHEYELLHF